MRAGVVRLIERNLNQGMNRIQREYAGLVPSEATPSVGNGGRLDESRSDRLTGGAKPPGTRVDTAGPPQLIPRSRSPLAQPDTRKPARKWKPGPHGRSGPKGKPGPHRHPSDPPPRPAGDDAVILYGWHPVVEALGNERRGLRRLLATENAVARLTETFGETLRIVPELVRPPEIGRLLGADAVHQGLYLEADPLPAPALDAMPEDALLLALDQITDPHNVGAIVRTAAASASRGSSRRCATPPRHRCAGEVGLRRARARPLHQCPQPRRGADHLGRTRLHPDRPRFRRRGRPRHPHASPPLVIVLGAEGKGLRERTRSCCDVLAKIPFAGAIRSLNVSNAAAITLYALGRSDP